MTETKTCMWGSTKHGRGQGSGVRDLSLTVPRSTCGRAVTFGSARGTGFSIVIKAKTREDKWNVWDIFTPIENGTPSFGQCSIRIVQNQTWLVGHKWYSHFGKLAIFYKVKHIASYDMTQQLHS